MQTTQDAREDLFKGKKILYVHGFASSGASGTVKSLRLLLPSATIIAPDLPIHPREALDLLTETIRNERPSLVIGTSMGGMLSQMLYGVDRILVNPAFEIADTFLKRDMLGKVTFHNPRKDGVQEFMLTKSLVQEFREVSRMCFMEKQQDKDCHVYGLFGLHDDVVDTYDLFHSHYANAIRFDGGHYLNDHTIIHSLLPVIQWIDDDQEGRHRPVILTDLEDVVAVTCGEPFKEESPEIATSVFALHQLSRTYDVHIVGELDDTCFLEASAKASWCSQHLGVAFWNRLTLTKDKSVLLADYFITKAGREHLLEDFMGSTIPLGSDTYKSWEDILGYFRLLGGQ